MKNSVSRFDGRATPRPGSRGEHSLQKKFGSQRRAKNFYNKQVLDRLNDRMTAFIRERNLMFVSSSDRSGHADCSFRAGPLGFVRVIDARTLLYPELRGNGVMATLGNLAENPNTGLLFLNFEIGIGLHVNGRASRLDNDAARALAGAEEIREELDATGKSRPECWVRIDIVEAYIHCSKHLPRMQSLPKNIAWGTDSVKEKLGDYFKVKTLSRPWQPVPLAATPTGSAQRESHYDLVDPAVVSNPFALYAQMRAHDPIWWSPQLGVWFVTRHEDCRRILVDPRFKATRMTTLLDLKFPDHRLHPSSVYFRFTNAAMMWTDGDRHRTHRAAVHPPFGAPQLERHRQTLRRVIDELLDDLIPRGRADAAPDICDEFPRRMVVATCALPAADKAILEDWTSDIAHFFLGPRPQRTIDDVNSGLYQLLDYCREKYRERGARPGDDLISEIVRASRSCDPELVVHQLALILLAGFSPTSPGLLGPGLLAFVEHPEQRRKFMAHPELRAGGVNEALRFNGSNQYTYRLCSERVELAPGMTIEAGDVVAPCLGSANRDPEVFENPDRFDIERVNSQRHLSFGYGPHFCLGAALGRMEGQVVFERLFSRIPDLQLDGSPQWNEYLEFRTLWSLPLKWSTP